MKNGWQTRTLGDVAEVIAGQSPEGSYYNTSRDGLPFYQGKKEFGERFIQTPTTWTSQITKVALEGDVLMSVRAPVGPVNFATEKSCIGRGLAAIRSGSVLDRNFLFYFLLSKQDEISGTEGAVKATSNPSSPSAARDGWRQRWGTCVSSRTGTAERTTPTEMNMLNQGYLGSTQGIFSATELCLRTK